MVDDDYELVSHKEIARLKQEIENLKKGDPAVSDDMVLDRLDEMVQLFRTASKSMKEESLADKLEDMDKKIEDLLDQNQKIAEGMLALADVVKGNEPAMEAPKPMTPGVMPPTTKPPISPPGMPPMEKLPMPGEIPPPPGMPPMEKTATPREIPPPPGMPPMEKTATPREIPPPPGMAPMGQPHGMPPLGQAPLPPMEEKTPMQSMGVLPPVPPKKKHHLFGHK